MLRAIMTVSGFTLVSRILGFLRDILIARFVGTGPVADAFVVAFRFPNMFRRIFGEGAYNAAFVPLFGRKVEEAGTEEAIKFARNTFSSLLWALGLVTLIAITMISTRRTCAWRSPAPLSTNQMWCCSMSRYRTWTPNCASKCGLKSSAFSAKSE
jgi:hypothetical protein